MTESDMIDGMFVFEIDHQATEPFPGCNQRKDCQSVDFCFAECIVNQWLESWIRFVSIDYDSPIGVDKLPKGRLFIQIRFTRPGGEILAGQPGSNQFHSARRPCFGGIQETHWCPLGWMQFVCRH